MLYCSLFLPYLTYCAEIWGNTYKSNTQCIFLLQKIIVRIVYGANFRDHTDVIFQDIKFFKFYDLVKLKICEVMYLAFNKTLPVNLNNIFTVCEPNYLINMRKKKIVHKYTRTNLKQCLSQWLVQSCGMSLILINETQKLFGNLKKKANGVYYPRMCHMFEYHRFEKRCSTLNIMAKLISLIC